MQLEELYKEIQPRIYAFFFMRTSSRESAEDLTQEVFYEALKSLPSFKGNATMATWLFSIAKNRLKKHYRSQKYRKQLMDRLTGDEQLMGTPEETLLEKEEKSTLAALISRLDPVAQEVVTLRVYGELSFKEIGMLVGKSENYARIAFHRAKQKIQKEMEGYHG